MKTKARRQELAASLTSSLEPQLGAADGQKSTKAIAATLDKLARQLAEHQRRQAKAQSKEAAKAAHQHLANQLLAALQPHLGEAGLESVMDW